MATERRSVALLAALCVLCASLAAAAPQEGGRWALLVGINDYQHAGDLQYCRQDAEVLGKVLIERAGFSPRRVIVLTDAGADREDHATRSNIRNRVTQFTTFAREDDAVLVFFAGHGVTLDKSCCLAPEDFVPGDEETAVGLDWVKGKLSDCRARSKLLVLDMCRPGSTRAVGSVAPDLKAAGNLTVWASCAPDQESHEEEGHGVFSGFLLEALKGAADADRDGAITQKELCDYVGRRMTDWCMDRGPTQTPQVCPEDPGLAVVVRIPQNEVLYRRAVEQAERFLGEQRWPEAEAAFKRALAVQGYEKDARALEGLATAQGGAEVAGRKAAYDRAVAAAREALAREDYQAAGDDAEKALALFPDGVEARTLLDRLQPTVTVTAELEGTEFRGAQISMDGEVQRDATPATFRLQRERTYNVEVTIPPRAGKFYSKASRTIRADRYGPQTFRAIIEELKLRVPAGFRAAPGTTAEPCTNTGWAKEIIHEKTGIEMVFIPAGEFMMGSPVNEEQRRSHEGPQHRVRITRPFYMGKYEVTQGQWRAVMGNNPTRFKGDAGLPVEMVSWNDCQEFIRKLGDGLRLPTEAEWEYACRAGSTTSYCFGEAVGDLESYAWYDDNSGGEPHQVGGKKPNAWGLYDMYGNVWEWCQDWYSEYGGSAADDPQGPTTGTDRLLRGGSWALPWWFCRSADRGRNVPTSAYLSFGFRVVASQ